MYISTGVELVLVSIRQDMYAMQLPLQKNKNQGGGGENDFLSCHRSLPSVPTCTTLIIRPSFLLAITSTHLDDRMFLFVY